VSPRRDAALLAARKIFSNRYYGADVAFVAGSIIRGDDTSYSDIDLVVVYPQLPAAYRESFLSDGFPVEAFVHDFSTLKYFFEDIDAKSGCPSLPSMVVEGVALPNEDSAEPFRRFASELLKKGPAMLEVQDIANRRYFITDLLDDLREPRNRAEALATGIRL
jgi:predicted nucleotidyltransferase